MPHQEAVKHRSTPLGYVAGRIYCLSQQVLGQRTREETDPINAVLRSRFTGPAGKRADGMNRNGLVLEISRPRRLKS